MLPRKRLGEAEGDSDNVIKKHLISSSPVNNDSLESSGNHILSGGNSCSNNRESCNELTITEMAFNGGTSGDIDEDLHSRQLAVYGRETMRRLFASNVLISGMQGLGVEIAKNLILTGVKSVTLHDEGTVELWDMSNNFIFSEKDIGKNRAQASEKKLQELNNAVNVSTLNAKLTQKQLNDFQAVVFTNINLKTAIEFNDYCHNHQPPIAFIKTEVRGLFGNVFCDFGPEFTVSDVDGEEPRAGIIASIANDNPALVACVDDERLEFEDGDLDVFSEIQGMTELNDGKARKIKSTCPNSFIHDEDATNLGAYERGGIVTQVKQPKVLNFKPLKEAIKDPGDYPLLHLAFQALDKFVSELGRFPVAGSEEDAQRLISITAEINDSLGDVKLDDINPKLLRHFAFRARAVLNPMAAMFGGIVGQEVIKACSGKFHPLFQFFYFDSVESLPAEPLDPSDFRPLNSRYDAQISVFGPKVQKKLEDAKVFLVGSGALGCEFMKNLALMGVSCGQSGKLTVTDDDVIEKSNLSRHLLFRDWNIGQAKSTVASSSALSINPLLHIEALQNRVGPETESVFNDTFWENLNVVINALDNVNAGLYVDQRCVYFQKPLLEKDDDSNYHMDLISSLANMRARNYSIPEVDKLKAKFIVGRIFPATATSTAMATGLACLKLYKVIDGAHKRKCNNEVSVDKRRKLESMKAPLNTGRLQPPQAWAVLDGGQDPPSTGGPPTKCDQVVFTKEDVEALLNEKLNFENTSDHKEKIEDQIKRLKQCIKCFQGINTLDVHNYNMSLQAYNTNLHHEVSSLKDDLRRVTEYHERVIEDLRRVTEYREAERDKELTSYQEEISAKAKKIIENNDKILSEVKDMESKCSCQAEEIMTLKEQLASAGRNDSMSEMEIQPGIEGQKRMAGMETQLDLERQRRTELEIQLDLERRKAFILQNSLDEAKAKIVAGEELRKGLHNTILELKGNIRVFCRVRPLSSSDGVGNDASVVSFRKSPYSLGQSIDLTQDDGQVHSFTFDKVFIPEASQEDVFVEISELVQSALDGYKVCIFAYGQTGSGKTHTMMGDLGSSDQKGLIPRSLEQIFETKRIHESQGWEYEMQVTVLEIYNDTIRDLLEPNRPENVGTNVAIVDVHGSEQVLDLLKSATQRRSVGETQMNERSSRSHFLFTLRITGSNKSTHQQVQGVLSLIDLAGSERLSQSGVTGDTRKESVAINKSLSFLNEVFIALINKNQHVPFRNSKLTRLLEPFLVNDSKMVMFLNISSEPKYLNESLSSLRFAKGVSKCETGMQRPQTNTRVPVAATPSHHKTSRLLSPRPEANRRSPRLTNKKL